MRRVLAIVVAVCAAAGTAAADGYYFTESIGGTDVRDELGETFGSAARLRISLGMRRKNIAVEAWAGAYIGEDTRADNVEREVYTPPPSLAVYGIDVKYLQPVSRHLEVYLRGGASFARLESGDADLGGRGLGVGAGVQLKGKVRALGFLAWPFFFLKLGPKVTGALWLDTSYDFYRLHPGGRLSATPATDAKLTSLSLGFALGSDF